MIDGIEELRNLSRAMDLADANVRDKAKGIVRKNTLAVERGAKLRAPVDTGNLRSSINSSFSGDAIGSPFVGEVGPEAFYGVFVELGTARMGPQPYLGPAFDEVEPSFLAALDDLAQQAAG